MNGDTEVDEISDGIYRICTHLDVFGPPAGYDFCQFLVLADEPLLVHTGMRGMFPAVAAGIARVQPVERLRWVSFSHVEGDECGALNELLDAAGGARAAFGALGCLATVNDLACRPPRPLADGEVLDLGGRRLRQIPTPHVPHNWEAQVLYEEVTGTLFCSDLLAQPGCGAPVVEDEGIVERALLSDAPLTTSPVGPLFSQTLRRLADLEPSTLAVMHGSSFNGESAALLRLVADAREPAASR